MKSKNILIGTIFIAFLMIATTTIARPMQEKTNFESIESIEQQTINSFETLQTELLGNTEFNNLLNKLVKDEEINSLINTFSQAKNEEEASNILEQLAVVIQGKTEFLQIKQIIGQETEGCSLCSPEDTIDDNNVWDDLDNGELTAEAQTTIGFPVTCLILFLIILWAIITGNLMLLFATAEFAKSLGCLWAFSSTTGNMQSTSLVYKQVA